jgi:site-specific recombinase XerD
MNTVKPWLNTSFVKKNGTSAVYLVAYIGVKSVKFNVYVYCHADNWDAKNLRISGNSKAVADDNLIIERCLARMNEIFIRYRLQSVTITPELLKNEWANPSRRVDFYAFVEEVIKEKKQEVSAGTIKHHKSVITIIKGYRAALAFAEINTEFLEGLQRWLKTKQKNDINTIHGKMRVLRNYLNIAVRRGIIAENPFAKVKLKKASVNRVFLSADEVKALWKLYKSKKLIEKDQRVLRHFLFMCLTGVRVSDKRILTRSNMEGGVLMFAPWKTKNSKRDLVKIPLNRYARQLIADEGSTTGLLFTKISDQKLNKYIKLIVPKAGITKDVSNHTGRHTFATTWLNKTNDLAQLQVLLGHSNISETMQYVHITEGDLKRQMKNFELGMAL